MSDFSSDLKIKAALNLKNILGWKIGRKIIVFSVDDYGNVRVDSKMARENMDKAGLKILNRFDAFDSLENSEDLEILYGVLSSVKDKNDRHAKFTAFSVPCNINFERMVEENSRNYLFEKLPETFCKLGAERPSYYGNTWDLWKEGISKGLMVPQFHGREHFNLSVFEEKIQNRDKEVLIAMKNRSYTSLSDSGCATIRYTAAFDFWKLEENTSFESIIESGLDSFEEVFGKRSVHFNPPGGREHPIIHKFLHNNGIKYIDTPFIKNEHSGNGKYKTVINYTGKRVNLNMICVVRNIVFEPTENRNIDWVNYALQQIETAFRWNRPAVISSHRVNYCGNINTDNRKQGINSLHDLLRRIVKKWPDVEFMSANEMADLIN